jgi:hypothetical protein
MDVIQYAWRIGVENTAVALRNRNEIGDMIKFNLSGTPNKGDSKDWLNPSNLDLKVQIAVNKASASFSYDFQKIRTVLNLPSMASYNTIPMECKWVYEYVLQYGSRAYQAGRLISQTSLLRPLANSEQDRYMDVILSK